MVLQVTEGNVFVRVDRRTWALVGTDDELRLLAPLEKVRLIKARFRDPERIIRVPLKARLS